MRRVYSSILASIAFDKFSSIQAKMMMYTVIAVLLYLYACIALTIVTMVPVKNIKAIAVDETNKETPYSVTPDPVWTDLAST